MKCKMNGMELHENRLNQVSGGTKPSRLVLQLSDASADLSDTQAAALETPDTLSFVVVPC